MRDLVNRYKRHDAVRSAALDLVRSLPPKDYAREVNAIFTFVRDRIRYTKDVNGVETVQTPPATLELEAGDCDDKATLLAAMLESVGHPTRFVAVGYTGPDTFQHVYVETYVGRRWVPLDATMTGAPVGWQPKPPSARMVVHN